MGPVSLALIPLAVLFLMIFVLRMPFPLGFFASGFTYFLVKGTDIALATQRALTQLNEKYVLIAVPLFIFTANVMNRGKITEILFDFANRLIGAVPGALGHVNAVVSLIFSGMTGSEIADVGGVGMMSVEAMTDGGYDKDFSCAVSAATATVGPIFPPSIPMVFYAMLTGVSIGKLFMGGMIPALILTPALMVIIAVTSSRRGYPQAARFSFREFIVTAFKAFPALLTPVILLGGIYSGIFTPTEAGAVAGAYALIIGVLVYRALGGKALWEILVDTVKKTGMLSLLVGSAYIYAYIIAVENIPTYIKGWLFNITSNPLGIFFIITGFFLLLGMVLDTSVQILIFIPMVMAAVEAAGINLIHFGVSITLTMMLSLDTPPFGMSLFIISGVTDTPLGPIIREVIPFVLGEVFVNILIILLPQLVLFLPSILG